MKFSILFSIVATVLISSGSSSWALMLAKMNPQTKLSELRSNYFLSGNLFGPQGLGNDTIKIVKPITLVRDSDSTEVGRCVFSIAMDQKFHDEALVIDQRYGLDEVKIVENIYDHHQTVFIQMSNIYYTPRSVFISCSGVGITLNSTVAEFEAATGNSIQFKRIF